MANWRELITIQSDDRLQVSAAASYTAKVRGLWFVLRDSSHKS